MDLHWPSETQSLRDKVAPYRDRTVQERIQAVGRLFDFYRELIRDPERRGKWEAARRRSEEASRSAFRRIVERAGNER